MKYLFLFALSLISLSGFSQITNWGDYITIQNVTLKKGESFSNYEKIARLNMCNTASDLAPGAITLESGSSIAIGINKAYIAPEICINKGAVFSLYEPLFDCSVGTESVARGCVMIGKKDILYYGDKHEGLSLHDDLTFGNNEFNNASFQIIGTKDGNFNIGKNFDYKNFAIDKKTGNICIGYPNNTTNVYSSKLKVNNDIGASRFLTSSDVRLKSQIKNLRHCGNNLLRLSAKKYNKETSLDNTSKEIGLIAQDVVDLFPEVVYKDQAGYMSIDYMSIVPLVIETMKEQQITIEKNQMKIDKLLKQRAM